MYLRLSLPRAIQAVNLDERWIQNSITVATSHDSKAQYALFQSATFHSRLSNLNLVLWLNTSILFQITNKRYYLVQIFKWHISMVRWSLYSESNLDALRSTDKITMVFDQVRVLERVFALKNNKIVELTRNPSVDALRSIDKIRFINLVFDQRWYTTSLYPDSIITKNYY